MLKAGDILTERYRIERQLGEGGMGTVYEAENIAIGKRVAIKLLRAEFAKSETVMGRFQREARAAASIGNDHIVEVFDFGQHEGSPFMVMELLKGESLATRIHRHLKLKPESAVFILTQVLEALAAAHGAGIVHRDLKPDNIFLTRRQGTGDFVKLLDFGISKFQDEASRTRSSVTQSDTVVGTPDYMAPEQALARRNVDHRADIYAAGVLLYQMLTGELPFSAETDRELLAVVAFRPAGMRTPREIDPTIAPEIEAIILKAMALERDQRYPDAISLSDALAPFCGEAPPSLRSGVWTPVAGSFAPATPISWEKPTSVQSIPAAPRVPAVTEPPANSIPSRRTSAFFAAGALALLVGVAGILGSRAQRTASTRVSTVRAPAVAATPALSPTVHFDLEGLSPNAAVQLDGLPVTPHMVIPRNGTHRLVVSAPGMISYETDIVADRDRSIAVVLAPAPAVAPAPIAGLTPLAPPSVPVRARVEPRRTRGTAATPAAQSSAPPSTSASANPSRSLLPFNTEY